MLVHVAKSMTHFFTIASSGTPHGRNCSVVHPASSGATSAPPSTGMEGQAASWAPASVLASFASAAGVWHPVAARPAAARAIRWSARERLRRVRGASCTG